MSQRAHRVFDIDPDMAHVSCMNCGAVTLATVDSKKISPSVAHIIPLDELESVKVKIKVPFKKEFMKTKAYNGYVTKCPFCRLQEEAESNQLLFYNGIMLFPKYFASAPV